ncbi:MAG: hypothetical protein FWC51_03855 [Proteobacteria bacterium]|nr:hypothetical protein [Pseudomonadota bacterium]
MRRIKIFLCMLFALGVFCTLIPAHADISSVKYVHDTIVTLKNIDVPIPAGISASNVNNVRYLLAMIDAANYKIGNPTNYASSPAALPNVVAAAKASSDIDTLIVYPQKFYVTVSAAAAFSFKISASGTFYVDWGDGTAFQTITKPDTTQTTYSYTFKTTGAHVISIWGKATGYNTNTQIAAISFENETRAFTIAGNLGHIFPTLGDGPGLQPSFYFIFRMASGLSGQLPAGMFDGLSGTLVDYMFADIFNGTKISGTIPPNLFGDMRGGYAYGMYQSAFYNCTGLTGSIPAGLFGHLAGPAQPYIFANTFYGCTGLTV